MHAKYVNIAPPPDRGESFHKPRDRLDAERESNKRLASVQLDMFLPAYETVPLSSGHRKPSVVSIGKLLKSLQGIKQNSNNNHNNQ